ncbi:hypothetical protein CLAIMM_13417 [Cladophialophora immunda]|nr:hypothetical protein CLAIMM_13417 [Cladophialophora immunda]
MHLLSVHSRRLKRFQDIGVSGVEKRAGYEKVRKTCEIAAADGFDYVWIDTCCIDKKSSAELSEAINSMYRWYQEAALCYVYLCDFGPNSGAYEIYPQDLRGCRWFKRGWTLQELIAPSIVIFLDQMWHEIGTKWTLSNMLTKITRIPESILQGGDLGLASVAQRMSWASHRKTTRLEDRAYSLMGIFGVNMPLLYGEGEKAFIRLQEEIMKTTGDCSILAWYEVSNDRVAGALAPSPDSFDRCTDMVLAAHGISPSDVIIVDGKGIHLKAWYWERKHPHFDQLLVLPCELKSKTDCVALRVRLLSEKEAYFERVDGGWQFFPAPWDTLLRRKSVCIRQGYHRTNCGSNLSRAAAYGNAKVVQLHLDQAADPNTSFYRNRTALEHAAMRGHEVLVSMLLREGVDAAFVNADGKTPIHHAIRAGHEAVVRMLIQRLPHVDYRFDKGKTPLMLAVEQGREKLVDVLLEEGADLEAKDDDAATALTVAVVEGNGKMVRLLLERGADLEATTRDGETPLAIAARTGNEEVVRVLLEHSAYLEAQNNSRDTPLLLAIENGHENVVGVLLEAGADHTVRARDGLTALDLVRVSCNKAIVQVVASCPTEPSERTRRQDLNGTIKDSGKQDFNGDAKTGRIRKSCHDGY